MDMPIPTRASLGRVREWVLRLRLQVLHTKRPLLHPPSLQLHRHCYLELIRAYQVHNTLRRARERLGAYLHRPIRLLRWHDPKSPLRKFLSHHSSGISGPRVLRRRIRRRRHMFRCRVLRLLRLPRVFLLPKCSLRIAMFMRRHHHQQSQRICLFLVCSLPPL